MKLSDYLKETGTTQKEFARLIGVTQGAVAFWLHTRPPTVERSIQIEKATGGSVRCEDLRPDIDWAYFRDADGSLPKVAAGETAQPANEAA